MSSEHFTVDGTLLEAWASQKSFRPRDDDEPRPAEPGNAGVDFHGEARRNDTHQSTTDPDARMAKKGGARGQAQLCGPSVDREPPWADRGHPVTAADGYAEVDAAITMLGELPGRRLTVAADKAYNAGGSSRPVGRWASPRMSRRSPAVRSTAGRRGIRDTASVSGGANASKRFGWMKTIGLLRKLRHRGGPLVDWIFTFTAAAYNLVRLRTLVMAPA